MTRNTTIGIALLVAFLWWCHLQDVKARTTSRHSPGTEVATRSDDTAAPSQEAAPDLHWFIPSDGECRPFVSPQQAIALIKSRGGDYEIRDSGGDRPNIAYVKSRSLRANETNLGTDTLMFFRTQALCEVAMHIADAAQKRNKQAYE